MNGWQFAAEVIKALAWPTSICGLALIFRAEVSGLLRAIKLAKAPGVEVQFEKEAAALSVEVGQVPAPNLGTLVEPVNIRANAVTADALRAHWASALDFRPAAAITESWNRVLGSLRDLYEEVTPNPQPVSDSSELIFRLKERGQITEELHGVLMRMLSMRNTVAHVPNFEPDEAAAREYQQSAMKVASTLEAALERHRALQARHD